MIFPGKGRNYFPPGNVIIKTVQSTSKMEGKK